MERDYHRTNGEVGEDPTWYILPGLYFVLVCNIYLYVTQELIYDKYEYYY